MNPSDVAPRLRAPLVLLVLLAVTVALVPLFLYAEVNPTKMPVRSIPEALKYADPGMPVTTFCQTENGVFPATAIDFTLPGREGVLLFTERGVFLLYDIATSDNELRVWRGSIDDAGNLHPRGLWSMAEAVAKFHSPCAMLGALDA